MKEHIPPYQQRLLILLAQGKTGKEVATALNITHGSVKEYSRKISQRLSVDPRRLPLIGERVAGCLAS